MRSDLKASLRTRLVTRLRSISARSKILITDEEASRILIECGCGLALLTDLGYVGQEKLETARRGLPDYEAVYLVSSSLASIQQICREMRTRPPLYSAAFILVTS
ncbi:hypothetical protein HK405_007932, partial [Cladochytrium tenue]